MPTRVAFGAAERPGAAYAVLGGAFGYLVGCSYKQRAAEPMMRLQLQTLMPVSAEGSWKRRMRSLKEEVCVTRRSAPLVNLTGIQTFDVSQPQCQRA